MKHEGSGPGTAYAGGLLPPGARVSRLQFSALLLLPALFLVLYTWHTPDVPLIQPDSEGYLMFSNGRSGGYPAFLAVLRPFISDITAYPIAQRFAYAVAVLVLGCAVLRSFGSSAIALLAEFALLFNPEVNRYHFIIHTESLFLTTSALFIATVLAYLRTARLAWLAIASALAGYATTIRPSGIVLLPLLAILLLAGPRLSWSRTWKYVLVAALCAGAVLSLESIYSHFRHIGPRTGLAPIHLLAKAGMVETAHPESIIASAHADTQPLQRALEVSLAPVRRLIAEAPNQAARCKLLPTYETFVQYQFAPAERAIATAGGTENLLINVALARLKHAGNGYLRLTLHHLQCLWSLGAATRQDDAEFASFIESRRPLPFETPILESLAGARSPPFAPVVLAVMYGIAALLLAAAIALLATLMRRRQPSLELAAAGLAGLIVHGSLLLTALTSVGIPRYVLGLWVPIAFGVGMSALWVAGSLRAAHRPRKAATRRR